VAAAEEQCRKAYSSSMIANSKKLRDDSTFVDNISQPD
jgi:hypothetical protein